MVARGWLGQCTAPCRTPLQPRSRTAWWTYRPTWPVCFAVGQSQNNPGDLFEEAQWAEEAGDIAEAERLYRILMKSDPTDAAAPFNLGNLLRASARNVEAEAALRAATRADRTFADAWYNLSDLLDEQGRVEAAIDCLHTALRVAPDYVDAMFNLALLLQRTSRYAEAADYWRHYLASDRQSEWAAQARRSLKFCEMQINLVATAVRTQKSGPGGLILRAPRERD